MRLFFWKFIARCLYRLRIRILTSRFPNRIGHLVLEPVCFVKENVLGLRKRALGIFPVPRGTEANTALVEMLKRCKRHGLWVATSPRWCRWAMRLAEADERLRIDLSRYSVGREKPAGFYEIERHWHRSASKPILRLTESERKRGREGLEKMGIPTGAWFVCFHCRSSGFSTKDDRIQDHRNAPLKSYFAAMKAVADAGGWVIRMGDGSSEPLPKMEGVIDYACSDFRSPFLDIFLCASCHLFIGNTSGLIFVAESFGVPSATTNLTPFANYPNSGTIGIMKGVYSESLGRELTFAEIMGSEVASYRLAHDYQLADLRVIDNTEEEIRELTLEALAWAHGSPYARTEEDQKLQARAFELLHPEQYAYGTDGQFGRDFLRSHRVFLSGSAEGVEDFNRSLMETKKKNQANVLAVLERKEARIKKLRKRVRELEQRVEELEKQGQ